MPNDISITGFNSDLDSALPIPFTSMGISKKRYGETAVYHLMQRIQLKSSMPIRSEEFWSAPAKFITTS